MSSLCSCSRQPETRHGLLPHPFLLSAFPYLHPQPLHLLQISLASPRLSYPFHLPQENQCQPGFVIPSLKPSYTHLPPQNLIWILPVLLSSLGTAPLLQSPLPTQPDFTHNLLTLPISQLLLPVFISFNSCWLFTVSSSRSCCPQTWSVTSMKLNLANISGKLLIRSGNRNNSVSFRLAKHPSALSCSTVHLANVLQEHPGFGWGYGLVMGLLTFLPS